MFGYLGIRHPLTVQTDLFFYIAHLFATITNVEEVKKLETGDALRNENLITSLSTQLSEQHGNSILANIHQK